MYSLMNIKLSVLACITFLSSTLGNAQHDSLRLKVVAFFTAKNDIAHITFVHEANQWFSKMAQMQGFTYDSTDDWTNLNNGHLKNYDVVVFLDTRPEREDQRQAFQQYMENGGGWIGFHFAAFALNNSDYPQNWNWYHNEFLASGEYGSNTWRPTAAILRVEDKDHVFVSGLPAKFKTSPNEWYRWKNDLRQNENIKVIMSIDDASFPLGTGPKEHEIWHSGDYPVVWTNLNYNMLYINMGHNDIDYEGQSNRQLSFTFGNPEQDRLVMNAVTIIGRKAVRARRYTR